MSTPLDQDLKEIDIVTCPTFYQFRAGYDRLIQIFKDLQIEGRTWIYPNGRIRHRWILSPGISPEIMKEIRSIHISLLPLEFHMTLSTDTEMNIYKYLITDYLMTKWNYDY